MPEPILDSAPQTGVLSRFSSSTGWFPPLETNFAYPAVKLFRSYRLYVKRIKPVIPALYPTEQVVGKFLVNQGLCSWKTKVFPVTGGFRYYTGVNLNWFPLGNGNTWGFPHILPMVARQGTTNWIPVISLDSEQLATNDLLSNLKKHDFSLSMTAAEAAETGGWLASRGRDIVAVTRSIRYAKWKEFRSAVNEAWDKPVPRFVNLPNQHRPKRPNLPRKSPTSWRKLGSTASDRWLEYRYAVTPLMYEAEAYAKWLSDKWKDFDAMTLVEGENWRWYEGSVSIRSAAWTNITGGFPGTQPTGQIFWKGRIVDKRVAYYRVVDYQKRMYASLGLTYGALPATAWEVVPWSFVFDWGINFGDYLSLIDADIGLEYVTGYKNSNLKCKATEWSISSGDTLGFSFGKPWFSCHMNRRIPLPSSSPRPGVVLRSAFGGKQLLDAVSLLRVFRRLE